MVKTLLFSSLLLLGTHVQGAVTSFQTIDSLEQAQEEFCDADQETLVVFDVDETLTCNFDLGVFIVYPPKDVPERDQDFVNKALAARVAFADKYGGDRLSAMFNSFYLLKGTNHLVETSACNLIHQLMGRGVKVIALTAIPAGAFGSVACGRTLRYANLVAVGIDFSSSFKQEEIVFDTLKVYNDEYPMFYKGILFTNYKNDKGSVLGAFFDRVGWCPKKVVFFDDGKKHVEDVADEMSRRGILFQGYWYRAAEKIARPPFDRQIAEVQLGLAINHETLLSATEAAHMLATQTH